MRPTERGAGGEVALAGAAGKAERADSVAEHAEVGKQAALTRLGEMLKAGKESERIREGRPRKNGSDLEPFPEREILADLGIDKKVSQPGAGKQAVTPFLRLGNCANCGIRIKLTGSTTTCPTCSAWRRWYVAHRIASGYLREATR